MSYQKSSIYIPTALMQPHYIAALIRVAGGVTEQHVTGSWLDDNYVVICEPVTIVTVIHDSSVGDAEQIGSIFAGIAADLFTAGERSVLIESTSDRWGAVFLDNPDEGSDDE